MEPENRPGKKRPGFYMEAKYKTWAVGRRMDHAVKQVLNDGMSMSESARRHGVSRSQLHVRVQKARAILEEQVHRGQQAQQAKRDGTETERALVISGETRRVPDFKEFDRLYFGNLICPDCGVHHETPAFHYDIMEAIESSNPRTVILCPPYHSKSTLVTVKHTIYKLVKNPNHRRLIVSKAGNLSRKFLGSISEYLLNPDVSIGAERSLLQDWGPFLGKGQWNQQQIFVAGRMTAEKDPSVTALGVLSQIYGTRADDIVFDDIADLDNNRTPESVAKMRQWVMNMALSRIGKSGQAIWVGTRVQAQDIYNYLKQLDGYEIIQYPCIINEAEELVLWPEHFPYSQVMTQKNEMTPADFQLVYQQRDIPGSGASFPIEVVEKCYDTERIIGQYDSSWVLIAGLDPAGGGERSGFTSMFLQGMDRISGKRYIVDVVNVKSMKAPQMRDQILEWANSYPLSEFRVETNGVQSQLTQYNEEIVFPLTSLGVRIVPHFTSKNKWDQEFGVETMAPLFYNDMISIPWGSGESQRRLQPFVDQLIQFPMGQVSDMVMAFWFAELGCRDWLKRDRLPNFEGRRVVPGRIRNGRKIIDLGTGKIRRHDPSESPYINVPTRRFVNVAGSVTIPA